MTAVSADRTGGSAAEQRGFLLEVAITVISHGHRDLLRESLQNARASLQAFAHPAEILVLENASEDGSGEMVRREFSEVRLLERWQRRGFAANQNELFRACEERARYILMLNDDAFLEPATVSRLAAVLDAEPDIAAVAPTLVYADGRFQSAGEKLPDLAYHLVRHLGLGRLVPARLRERLGTRAPRSGSSPSVRDTGYVLGACVLLRSTALSQVGELDERFAIYSEDADWCRRAGNLGWRICVAPDLRVVHLRRQSWGLFSATERERSMYRYLRKHGTGSVGMAILKAIVLVKAISVLVGLRLTAVLPGGADPGHNDRVALNRALIEVTLAE